MLFSRYIFIREMQQTEFDPSALLNQTFFKEVFMCLTTRTPGRVGDETARMRAVVKQHVVRFMRLARLQPVEFNNGGQTAMYEADQVLTAYTVNIKLRYGNCLRTAVNRLLRVRERTQELRQALRGSPPDEVQAAVRHWTTVLVPRAKRAVVSGDRNFTGLDRWMAEALQPLVPVLDAYPPGYEFKDGDVEVDAQKNPERHLKAFFRLARVLEDAGARAPQTFPLRTSWVPAHTRIDTSILWTQVLGQPNRHRLPVDTWGQVVDLGNSAFPLPPVERNLQDPKRYFWGSVQTDGVSICITRKTRASHGKRGLCQRRVPERCAA
ncbi:hypothetical protein H4R19_003734 [Coemansia spiralis]|nr:hypothetical protein H4R19_003734 [Coemansia spiralis]